MSVLSVLSGKKSDSVEAKRPAPKKLKKVKVVDLGKKGKPAK